MSDAAPNPASPNHGEQLLPPLAEAREQIPSSDRASRVRKLPIWAIATIFAVAGLLIGTAGAGVPLALHVAEQRSEITALAHKDRQLTSQRDQLSTQLSSANSRADACQSKVDALNGLIAAVSTQLTAWGADPLGYTADTSQITAARDKANAVVGC